MVLPQELLEILACPICKTPVQPTADHSGLKCGTCRRTFPVLDDIPGMRVEDGKSEEEN
jgi:uncharacterized protein